MMKMSKRVENPADWLTSVIKYFVNGSPENTIKNAENEKAWEDPVVGFSSGDDPLYYEFKQHIGSFHWTPIEIFAKTFPQLRVTADQLTVISWVLPHTEATKSDNRKETSLPTERWARARIYGEEVNEKLRRHVVATLQKAGYEAVAPSISPFYEKDKMSERYGLASSWSERHAAYTSGLGTFGLCDGIISPRGKAIRIASVVANIKILPTNRPYDNRYAYCLFVSKGKCGQCISRCPVGAISEAGIDKMKCANYNMQVTTEYVRSHFGFKGYGCGKCHTGVPCESSIPIVLDEKDIQHP